VGLLEAAPNKPLPWKGVLLVLIPGLIFFVSQIEQVTSNNDWFFLAFYRAGYFLILPVLLVWLLTRRFPVWGLIPLGLLYETLWNYGQRVDIGSLPWIGRFVFDDKFILFNTRMSIYNAKYIAAVAVCLIPLGVLIWYHASHRQIPRVAWIWLGLYGLLIVLRIGGAVYQFYEVQGWTWPAELMEYLYQMSLWYLYDDSLPFLLLVFIGLLFAHRHGGFSFLILLGYLLPTVVFGRYGAWNNAVPFYLVSPAVLIYRFIVALVAPIWLVRAASIQSRQRAAAIPVAAAIVCHITLYLIIYLGWGNTLGYPTSLIDFATVVWWPLLIAVGLGLAVALYLPKREDQAAVSPPALVGATE
jgi:hypothetical protein